MILKIDPKFIEDTIKRKNEHGYVYIKYGEFEPRFERKVVKEPIPVIGKIFPFLKRRVVRNVKTDKQDLVMHEERVDFIRARGESAPKMLQDQLEKMPYRRIVKLDEKIYGDLYVGHMKDQKYNLLTNQGVVIGQFDMTNKGYYYPYMNGLLPKEDLPSGLPLRETSPSKDKHQSYESLGVEDIVANYMAKNPDSKEFIPQNLYEKFPDLNEQINKESQKVKSNSNHDFTLN